MKGETAEISIDLVGTPPWRVIVDINGQRYPKLYSITIAPIFSVDRIHYERIHLLSFNSLFA